MIECEATGKNIEQAITNALFELRALREDVDIKILDQGGFFRKARVYVKISDDAIEKYQKVKKLTEEEKKEESDIQSNSTVEEKTENLEKEEKIEEPNEVLKEEKNIEDKSVKNNFKKDIDEASRGKSFLEGLLEVLGNNSKVFVEEKEDEIFYEIKGEDANKLIGYRGDCLNAVQYLVSLINSKGNRHSKKVRLDIDGFKERVVDGENGFLFKWQ